MSQQEATKVTHISKWGTRHTRLNSTGRRVEMKQVVILHKLEYKTQKGNTAYRSETRHIPVA